MIHIPDDEVPTVFAEFRRVLRPGGPLLLAYHGGAGSRLKTEGYGGLPMNVHVHRRGPAQVAAWLVEAGFAVEGEMESRPAPDLHGVFLFARREPVAP